MDTSSADRILDDYVKTAPGARHASLHDPEFVASVHMMRTVLTHLETALTAEGLNGQARHRVGTRLTLACLGAEQPNPVHSLAQREINANPDMVQQWKDSLLR